MDNSIEIVRIRNRLRKTLNELHFENACNAVNERFTDKKAVEYFKLNVNENTKDTCMTVDSVGFMINLKHSYEDLFKIYSHNPSRLFARLNYAKTKPDYRKDKRFHNNCIYKVNRMIGDWISEVSLNITDDLEIDNFDKKLVFVSYDFKMKKFYLFQYSRFDLGNDFFSFLDRSKYSTYTKSNRGYYFDMVCVSPEYLEEVVNILKENNYKTSLVISASELKKSAIGLNDYLDVISKYYIFQKRFYLINGNDVNKFEDVFFLKN